ncbi:MAG: hypothetical protein DRQ55_05405 [Planctomycetota bacterium]|nr:MAG: hypothetical protein DRQ55_05405 [Planctomycetota bacterium]
MDVRALYQTLLAWLLPGLGHLAQKRYAKACYFGGLVLGCYALGVWLGEGASVSAARYPYHVYGQYGAGLPAFLASLLGAEPTGRSIDRLELGVVFTTVAGILNLVVMIDAYEWRRRGGHLAHAASGPSA